MLSTVYITLSNLLINMLRSKTMRAGQAAVSDVTSRVDRALHYNSRAKVGEIINIKYFMHSILSYVIIISLFYNTQAAYSRRHKLHKKQYFIILIKNRSFKYR